MPPEGQRFQRENRMNLNQITLPSTDLARAVEFYRCLGFTQIVSNLPSYARFECPDGSSTFSLHRVDRVAPDSGVIVYFECSDLDAKVHELKTRGVLFDSPPEDQRWLWREAYLRDPDGNVICLYYAGENRRNPPWRIPPGQTLTDADH
jgi:catechol 2,3-dioxygenase-like lactoylglutathione lyase family enzyme